MKITVLGAGAWGTALAAVASLRHPTLLWARDPAQVLAMQATRTHPRYLPGITLPEQLAITADARLALEHGREGLTLIATPMAGLRAQLALLGDERQVAWACKGFETGSGRLGHEIARSLRPGRPGGVLSGPSFALEVARGQATALVAASEDPALTAALVAAFHSPALRVYSSPDVIGVEIGGAVKNVLAIAVGILDGMAADDDGAGPGPGLNARAALITRGLAEMTRLGLALGAQAATFMGLSGLGDLVLTATGELSRNRRVGLALAAGHSLQDVLASLGHVAEGVASAATALERARELGVEMPITEAVARVLEGRLEPRQALQALMTRESRTEG